MSESTSNACIHCQHGETTKNLLLCPILFKHVLKETCWCNSALQVLLGHSRGTQLGRFPTVWSASHSDNHLLDKTLQSLQSVRHSRCCGSFWNKPLISMVFISESKSFQCTSASSCPLEIPVHYGEIKWPWPYWKRHCQRKTEPGTHSLFHLSSPALSPTCRKNFSMG